MSSISRSPEDLNGVFVSHEHSDHIKGIGPLVRKHKIPLYINRATYHASSLGKIPEECINFAETGSYVNIGNCEVNLTHKEHDAVDPVAHVVEANNKSLGVFMDIGKPCNNVRSIFPKLDAAFLEFNHDVDMLLQGSYPWFLKHRIAGEKGHLSNFDACNLINNHSDRLRQAFFSHMSQNNNSEEKVSLTYDTLVKPELKSLSTSFAGQFEAMPLRKI